ncbi:N-acetylneuraminate synthase [Clostridium beijerinckii]|uniref:N-acetylneuraminate synthase n=1 Tax=Clostridium beijerinckii TaxID=1520 RepID=A0A7X9SP33_CLOBE|nr:N-acetylneuraminate synthase [Clostridium beijerinckii]NMF05475.1 N-acetylneuraminate synthase [Clostridium beijerinckii]NRY63618.1 N-acetylneuraminate synthase/N,N'-diacetyllegionaminate synthase [Clostridium beijerinckii]
MNSIFIIAEAGVNHNGDINIAKKMIDNAVLCGVDAIKFQTFNANNLVTKDAKQAKYQINNLEEETSQLEMLKKLELSHDQYKDLKKYCEEKNIIFLSSPFDLESIEFLDSIEMKIFKIPSSEIDNVPYLRKIAMLKKKVILSTGMSNLSDIEFALDTLRTGGTEDIVVLHCNTDYPTKMEDVNLKAMETIRNAFKTPVGYSDHTSGIEVAIAASALGATVIEKHFTLDRNMIGPDHKASLEPFELRNMVIAIRNIEIALGNGIKHQTLSEKVNSIVGRKSLVAKVHIKANEVFTEKNLCIKRPGTGVSPKNWDYVIGKKAKRDFQKDELIDL